MEASWEDVQRDKHEMTQQEFRYAQIQKRYDYPGVPSWIANMWSFPIPSSKLDEIIEMEEFDQKWRAILVDWKKQLPVEVQQMLEIPPAPIRPADITRILPSYKAARKQNSWLHRLFSRTKK